MLILAVELENIRTHRNTRIALDRGFNLIQGINGVGKTTLFLAIGLAVFDHCPIRLEQLVRSGSRSGQIQVELEDRSGNRWLVRRFLGSRSSWTLYTGDGEMVTRTASATREALSDMMAVDEGLSIRALFSEVIGVDQGQLHAAFDLSESPRKKVFEPLFRTTSFLAASDRLREAATQLRSRLDLLAGQIGQGRRGAEGLEDATKRLRDWRGKLLDTEARHGPMLKQLTAAEEKHRALQSELELASAEDEKASVLALQLKEQTTQLAEADARLGSLVEDEKRRTDLEPLVSTHRAMIVKSQQLEKEVLQLQAQRDLELEKIQSRIQKKDHLTSIITDLSHRISALESEKEDLMQSAKKSREELERHEASRTALKERKRLHLMERRRLRELEKLQKQLISRYGRRDALETILAAPVPTPPPQPDLEQLEEEQSQLQKEKDLLLQHRSQVDSELQRLEHSREQLADGCCPLLDQKCLNLVGDEAILERDINSAKANLTTVRGDLKKYQQRLRRTAEKVSRARTARQDHLAHEQTLVFRQKQRTQQNKIEAEILELRLKMNLPAESVEEAGSMLQAEVAQQVSEGEAISAEEAAAEAGTTAARRAEKDLALRLKRKRTLLDELEKQRAESRSVLSELISRTGIEGDSEEFRHQLEEMRAELKRLQGRGAENADLEREYLKLEGRLTDVAALKSRRKKIVQQIADLTEAHRKLGSGGPAVADLRKGVEILQKTIGQLGPRVAHLHAELEEAGRRLDHLVPEVAKLEALKVEVQAWEQQREELQQAEKLLDQMRNQVFRQAGPRVVSRQLEIVSRLADLFYSDVTQRTEDRLIWRDNFDIVVLRGDDEVGFRQLSGGEKTAAALAVRLALLQAFSPLRLALLDEPTPHLDESNRRRLAETLAGLDQFDQVIVVSQDDTFDHLDHHTIRLEKVGGVTQVAANS